MAEKLDRCDILDMLEESAVTGRAVKVEAGGKNFVDRVQEVITKDGEDFADFLDHGRLAVSDIRDCARA